MQTPTKRIAPVAPPVAVAVKIIAEKVNVVITVEKEPEAHLVLVARHVPEKLEAVADALLVARQDVTHRALIPALVNVAIHALDIVISFVMVVVPHYVPQVVADHHHLPWEEAQHQWALDAQHVAQCVRTIVLPNQHRQKPKLPVAVLVVAQATVQTRARVHVIIRAAMAVVAVVATVHQTVPAVVVLHVLITVDTHVERIALRLALGYVHHAMVVLDAQGHVLKNAPVVAQMSVLGGVGRIPVPRVVLHHALAVQLGVMDVVVPARDVPTVAKGVPHVLQNALLDALIDAVVHVLLNVEMDARRVAILCVRTAANRTALKHVMVHV